MTIPAEAPLWNAQGTREAELALGPRRLHANPPSAGEEERARSPTLRHDTRGAPDGLLGSSPCTTVGRYCPGAQAHGPYFRVPPPRHAPS